MRLAKTLTLSLFMLFGALSMMAQSEKHEIHLKNGEILNVTILEIGTEDIKYEDPHDPTIQRAVQRAAVSKVVYADGSEEILRSGIDSDIYYADQKKQAIKANLFSPAAGNYLELLYERNLEPGTAYELALGIIGLGDGRTINEIQLHSDYTEGYRVVLDRASEAGAFVRAGYKFTSKPTYIMDGMRYSHLLHGGYIRPEVVFGTFRTKELTREISTGTVLRSKNVTSTFGGLFINLGKQWVFGDTMVLDISGGIGYGSNSQDIRGSYAAAFSRGSEVGIATRGSINVGFLIK